MNQSLFAPKYKNIYAYRMSLQTLRSFVEVYRSGSISDAARALGLTQPAVSQHIAALETQLGKQLFVIVSWVR